MRSRTLRRVLEALDKMSIDSIYGLVDIHSAAHPERNLLSYSAYF